MDSCAWLEKEQNKWTLSLSISSIVTSSRSSTYPSILGRFPRQLGMNIAELLSFCGFALLSLAIEKQARVSVKFGRICGSRIGVIQCLDFVSCCIWAALGLRIDLLHCIIPLLAEYLSPGIQRDVTWTTPAAKNCITATQNITYLPLYHRFCKASPKTTKSATPIPSDHHNQRKCHSSRLYRATPCLWHALGCSRLRLMFANQQLMQLKRQLKLLIGPLLMLQSKGSRKAVRN